MRWIARPTQDYREGNADGLMIGATTSRAGDEVSYVNQLKINDIKLAFYACYCRHLHGPTLFSVKPSLGRSSSVSGD